ncbi:MAG: hypothetical protein WCK37_01330 [Candidatus Falkowbacteria bacterium]
MLDVFFGSKARVKLLKLFFLNPDESYYLRQIARDLDLQVNSVRRELKSLESFGVLVSDAVAPTSKSGTLSSDDAKTTTSKTSREKHYYRANKNFILFPEIRSFILKSQILAGENFVKELREVCEPELLFLTGVFVGDPSIATDVMLVADVKKTQIVKLIKNLEQEIGREINYTVMDPKEFTYRREIADVFVHRILVAEKIVLLNPNNFIFPQIKDKA